jgi:amino acid adenylation domain-containing protein
MQEFPLSPGQRRLWFAQQYDEHSSADNMVEAWWLRGHVDTGALCQAIAALTTRHDALRTRFLDHHGVPFQVIDPGWPSDVETITIPADSGSPLSYARDFSAQLSATPFDLRRGPVFKAYLLRQDPENCFLVLGMHHIVSDGWSIGLLARDLAANYNAQVAGRKAYLPELPMRYADYALRQQEGPAPERLMASREYWQGKLAGATLKLDLPITKPRPSALSDAVDVVYFDIPSNVADEVFSLGRRVGCTRFSTLLAAFQVFLLCITGQSDILVGVPVANRGSSEIENLVGFFVNTLILRARFDDQPDVLTALARTRQEVLSASEHAETPFEDVVKAINPARTIAFNPIVQVLFQVLEDEMSGTLDLAGIEATKILSHNGIARFDLLVELQYFSARLRGVFRYSPDLFDRAAVEYLSNYFVAVLAAMSSSPESLVTKLPIASARAGELDIGWPDRVAKTVRHSTVVAAYTEQAAATPNRVAVAHEGSQVSFSQLSKMIYAVSGAVIKHGVRRGEVVGVAVGRSAEMVASVLGVLRAGAAFLPLEDHMYPADRLAFMARQAGVRLILTAPGTASDLASRAGARAIAFPRRAEPAPDLEPPGPSDLAYVLFTSGSTGTPKGVMVEHRSLANLLESHRATAYADLRSMLGNRPLRIAYTYPLSFDGAWEALLWMIDGHELHIVSEEDRRDTDALLDFIRAEKIDVLHTTPSLLERLISGGLLAANEHQPAFLGIGGEAMSAQLWNLLARRETPLSYNFYGPTECTVDALACRITGSPSDRPLIGRPLVNCDVFIINAAGQAVPAGVAGEIILSGPHLARGYLGDPALTASRFIPDALSGAVGARSYRTGDTGRFTLDGNVEFLGRADRQIKLRGFRVEPREIEAALLTLPGIHDAVVVLNSAGENARLVAYLVRDSSATEVELQAELARTLPDYMVPSAFVDINSVPLGPTGKLDARRLPAPGRLTGTADLAEPLPGLERSIAAIFAAVIGIDHVGRHDNFFSLGGHSLNAVEIASRIEQETGVRIRLRVLFDHPTVRGLAQVIFQQEA